MNSQQSQQPDSKPGAYYVSVVDGQRLGKLLGPFLNDHAGALAMVDQVREKAEQLDPRGCFYAYGTVRLDLDSPLRPGLLNECFGMPS